MKKYYLHDGKNQQGPYSLEELKQMELSPSLLIWHEGLDEWKKIHEIFSVEKLPPPLNKATPPTIKNVPASESSKKSNIPFRIFIALLGGFAFYIFLQVITSSNSYDSNKYEIKSAIREHEEDKQKDYYRKTISSLLNPHTNNYQKDAIMGGIWDLVIKMDNPSPYFIESVQVSVHYIKADKTVFKSELVTFRNMEPGKRSLESAPNSEKGVQIHCRVENIKCSALNL